MEVPLGVHGIQNRPLSDRSCNLSAAYLAFPKKPADRIDQKFLLPEDGAIIIHAAAQSSVFDRGPR